MRIFYFLLVIFFFSCQHNVPAVDLPVDQTGRLAEQNNRFSFELYRHLSPESTNLLFSPYSLSNALAMTLGGAGGDTAKQMDQALGVEMEKNRLFPAFAALNRHINGMSRDEGVAVLCANGVWSQVGHPFKEDFIRLAGESFAAELRQVDFKTGYEQQRLQINLWVEGKTKDKIKDLFPEGILDPMTRMVLVNAIYFKGDWEMPFDGKRTRDMPFWVSEELAVQVPMMRQQDAFHYTRDERLQMIAFPYAGKSASMLILLPDKQGGIKDVENVLTTAYVNSLYDRLDKQKVNVLLPRFKIAGEFSLSETLQAMGMRDAFDTRADFSGMDGSKNLYISDVVHKAIIEVDEKGSEAAAATGVVMQLKSAPVRIPLFTADHPFIFLIRENKTGAILFLGRLAQPENL